MALYSALSERTVGKYPLSVATSLALEAACGIHDDFPVAKAPVLGYSELWVNLRTLFRNLLGSLDRNSGSSVVPELLAQALAEEMDLIADQVREVTQGRCQAVFYYSNYNGLERKYSNPIAVLRMDTTAKQKEYTAIHNLTMGLLLKSRPDSIQKFELLLKPAMQTVALMLTHYAYDLLSHRDFTSLTLLESHTGRLKERAEWYTKFSGGQELSRIPFREDMLQVFGDSEIFRPSDIRLRRELVDIAERYKWTAITTRDKIVYGVDQMQNPYFRDALKSILVS